MVGHSVVIFTVMQFVARSVVTSSYCILRVYIGKCPGEGIAGCVPCLSHHPSFGPLKVNWCVGGELNRLP